MTDTVHELDDVALLRDWPEHALVASQVGTVVQSLADDHLKVEFNGEDGRANAMAALPARNLMVLHYAPVTAQRSRTHRLPATAGFARLTIGHY